VGADCEDLREVEVSGGIEAWKVLWCERKVMSAVVK
jgi:hypothetical protein